jgi:hypothetical protein
MNPFNASYPTTFLGYEVEVNTLDNGTAGSTACWLNGPRGARLQLIRSTFNPAAMFVWNCRTNKVATVHGNGWFTDTRGTLEVW